MNTSTKGVPGGVSALPPQIPIHRCRMYRYPHTLLAIKACGRLGATSQQPSRQPIVEPAISFPPLPADLATVGKLRHGAPLARGLAARTGRDRARRLRWQDVDSAALYILYTVCIYTIRACYLSVAPRFSLTRVSYTYVGESQRTHAATFLFLFTSEERERVCCAEEDGGHEGRGE